jgi:dolichol-phosphate mannosyltransferase
VTKVSRKAVPFISVVSPVYNAEYILETLIEKVTGAITTITHEYEIILVEDGSRDQSWNTIKTICSKNTRVKGIKLSRNFGQHNAISACLEHSQGEYVVLMDCDLQDDPAYIPEMYKLFDSSIDYVLSRRKSRRQNVLRRTVGKYFFRVYNWIARTNIDGNIGAFSMLSRRFVDAYLRFATYQRFYLTTVNWLGFKGKVIEVENKERFSGVSSYNIGKLVRVSLNAIIANSDRLLNISIAIGLTFMTVSFLGALYLVTSIVLFGKRYAVGWPSFTVLILFCTGLILFSLGIMALYVAKIFEQVKNLPRYVVEDTLNC